MKYLTVGFELMTKGLPLFQNLAYVTITFMPKLTCSDKFRQIPYNSFKPFDVWGFIQIGQFTVPLRTNVEKCTSIYFINDTISFFPAINLNFEASFKVLPVIKSMQKKVFLAYLKKLI